ncbi:beta strand repeat-containing protein, partial [Rhodopirellula baltica]
MTDANGMYSVTTPPGPYEILLEINDPHLPPLPQITTANSPQFVNLMVGGGTAGPIGVQSLTGACALDWADPFVPADFFGGWPSDGPTTDTQNGRSADASGAFTVGAGDVTVSFTNTFMFDADMDGTIDHPRIQDSRRYGFENTTPYLFLQKRLVEAPNLQDDDVVMTMNFPYTFGAENISFVINDIDRNSNSVGQVRWMDRVMVVGERPDGTFTTPTLTVLGGSTKVGVTGGVADGLGFASDSATNLTDSANVRVDFGAEAIRNVFVTYQVAPRDPAFNSQYPAGNQGIGIGRVAFTRCDVPPPGTVAGVVFNDIDGDGVQDAGELGIPNIDVEITDSFGNTVTVTTDGSGNYTLDVVPGNTTINVIASDPDMIAGANLTTGNDPQTVTVNTGATTNPTDVGYQALGTINGHVFVDTNGNGVQDGGEADLANVDVVITDEYGNAQTVSTDGNGDYTATVAAGDATVNVDESDPQMIPGATLTTSNDPQTVTVTGGAASDATDTGYQSVGTINGQVFLDTNGDGVQDGGEPGLPNVDVVITDEFGNSQTVSTDANGEYTASVAEGDVTVNVDESDPQMIAGATLTTSNDPQTVAVTGGSTSNASDTGYQALGTINGHVFVDTNGNGTQDGGEADLANVDVVITDQFGNVQTVSTDGNGDYTATVAAGDVSVNVDETDPDMIAGATLTTSNDPQTVTVTGGSSANATDTGYQGIGSVSGHVFVDTNGNGIQDGGEADLANVDVVITDAFGNVQT